MLKDDYIRLDLVSIVNAVEETLVPTYDFSNSYRVSPLIDLFEDRKIVMNILDRDTVSSMF